MDLDPDPNRRFSPVRIPKRFCRRIDLVRKDATVTAIGRGGGGAHSYFNVGTPSPRNRLGKLVFQPLENRPIFGFLFSGGAVPGSGGEKALLP